MDTPSLNEKRLDHWQAAATRTALVAGIFCAVVIALLFGNYLRARAWFPVTPKQVEDLQVQLAKHPGDESVKDDFRRLDLRIRQEYFRGQQFAVQGAGLLLGGLVVFLLAGETARRLRPRLPVPGPKAARPPGAAALDRRTVVALGIALAGVLVSVAMFSKHDAMAGYARALALLAPATGTSAPASGADLPAASPTAPLPAGTVASPAAPAVPAPGAPGVGQPPVPAVATIMPLSPFPASWAQNWPQFRGPGGMGVATADLPRSWNGKTGEGIRWKAAIPLPGENSPIVWGDRVFLSGATDRAQAIFCFDAGSGKLLWKADVSTEESGKADPPKVMEDTGYAAPTMATDGERAVAIFASGDVVAVDFTGKVLWARNLGLPDSSYGYAASLAFAPARLFVQFDQGSSPDAGKSSLLALNPANGDTVWEQTRPVPNSWSSPVLIHTAQGDQLVACGNPWVIAYDPGSGSELWRANCLSGDVAPSPVYAGGKVYATTAYASLAAIRTDGRGDVTKTHIAWLATEGLPDTVSPVSNGDIVLLADSGGTVTCYEAAGGKKLWEHGYTTFFRASPLLAGTRVYMVDTDGVTHVIEAGRSFREWAVLPLGEPVNASPACAGGQIFLRGKRHLYCIGAK